jgi:hypothetical protein
MNPNSKFQIPNSVVAGRYQILRVLGSGGMASVYLAHDPLLRRDVAIKVPRLDGDGADGETLQRFQDELRAIGRLNHPHIVTIYDGGEEDGTPYLVMEPVEGESLAQLIRREAPLPPARSVDIARQISDALAYAHGLGVVHRDVKPQNVLLDKQGRAKVTDFGIAKSSDITRTIAGTILGTPSFMAPEVSAGEPVTRAADVYAVGVVLYQMLTGHTPFESDNAIAAAVRSQREDPRPPSQLAPVPAWLDAVVLRALAREPRNRYANAEELAAALSGSNGAPARTGAWDAETTTISRPQAAGQTVVKRRGKRPSILVLLPIVVLSLAVIGVGVAASRAPAQQAGASGSPTAAPKASASAGQPNLVANGDMASNGEQPAGWKLQVFGGREPTRLWRPGGPGNGDREITLQSSSGTDSAWIGNDANVQAGSKLTLTGFVKTDKVGGDGPGAGLRLSCHDGAGKITGESASQALKGNANWSQLQAQLTAPAGTTACQPQLRLGDQGKQNNGTAEFSRIALTAG